MLRTVIKPQNRSQRGTTHTSMRAQATHAVHGERSACTDLYDTTSDGDVRSTPVPQPLLHVELRAAKRVWLTSGVSGEHRPHTHRCHSAIEPWRAYLFESVHLPGMLHANNANARAT